MKTLQDARVGLYSRLVRPPQGGKKSVINRPKLIPIAIAVLLLTLAATLRFRPVAAPAPRPASPRPASSALRHRRPGSGLRRPRRPLRSQSPGKTVSATAHPIFSASIPSPIAMPSAAGSRLSRNSKRFAPPHSFPRRSATAPRCCATPIATPLRVHDQAWVTETQIATPAAPPAHREVPLSSTPPIGAGLFRVAPWPSAPARCRAMVPSPSSPTRAR